MDGNNTSASSSNDDESWECDSSSSESPIDISVLRKDCFRRLIDCILEDPIVRSVYQCQPVIFLNISLDGFRISYNFIRHAYVGVSVGRSRVWNGFCESCQ